MKGTPPAIDFGDESLPDRETGARVRLFIGPLIARESVVLRYVVAVSLVAAVCLLRLALVPVMGTDAPLLPFVLAVFAAAYLGGLGPALVAAFLTPLAAAPIFTAWLHGTHVLAWTSHAVFFVVVSGLVAFMMQQLQRSALIQQQSLREARRSERTLLDVQRSLSLALRAGRAGSFDWSIDTDRLRFSEESLALYGFTEEQFPRTFEAWLQSVDEADRAGLRTAVEAACREGEIAVDFRMRRQDSGEVRWIHSRGQVIFDESGKPARMLGINADVTESRLAEEKLLERDRMLIQADRRKDEFLAMLAHELRNPLAPIRTIAHVLKSDRLDLATIQRNSELLQRQASHLARLVDDLLDVARITRGSIELRKERVSLHRVLDAAIETVQPVLVIKRQTLDFSGDANDVHLEADATRLVQVFGNLLSNAAKYSPERALIEVRVERSATEAVVSIRDRGEGIAPEILPHIFDLFVQGDHSLDRSQGGLGVGLTVVRRLVDMHGGSVEARSAGQGHGSEFVVTLPRLKEADMPPEPARTEAATPLSRQRVLIVDDNADAADSLLLFLQMAGHDVRVAYAGTSALATLETFEADFVLLDIGLPDVDGYAVARTIRQRWPRLPVVIHALTGYGRSEDQARARESGCDGHMTKPVDPDQLLQLIGGPAP